MEKSKSVAGGVLNIIGAIFTFIGVLYLSICAAIADAVDAAENIVDSVTTGEIAEASISNSVIVWVVGLMAFVVAICAAVFAFKHNIVGGILAAVAAVALLVLSIVLGYWAVLVIIAMVLLAIGSLLTFLVKKPIVQPQQPYAQPQQQPMPPYGQPQQPVPPSPYGQPQQPYYGQQPPIPPYGQQQQPAQPYYGQPTMQQSASSEQSYTSQNQQPRQSDDWNQIP